MKKVSFEQLGLVNLSAEETQDINGGAWPKWLKGVTWVDRCQRRWQNTGMYIKKRLLKAGWNSIK